MTHSERRARRRKIADALRAGASVAECCQRFGVCGATVCAAAVEHGEHRPVGRPSSVGVLRMIGMMFAGMSQSDVAREVGLTVQAVQSISIRARNAGIPVPTRKRGRTR